jgi:SAM-dependent methyltransferase
VAAAELGARVEIVQGVMEALPHPDGHFDFVWCRDVVEQLDLIAPALKGAARVLKQDGRMLVYTVFATDLLAHEECEMLERHMGNVSSNLVERHVEEAFGSAGLAIERKEVIGTEYKEYVEERTQPGSRTLLRIARLRRLRRSVIESHGEDIYNHVEANLHWEVFQFLGKLQAICAQLRRSRRQASGDSLSSAERWLTTLSNIHGSLQSLTRSTLTVATSMRMRILRRSLAPSACWTSAVARARSRSS